MKKMYVFAMAFLILLGGCSKEPRRAGNPYVPKKDREMSASVDLSPERDNSGAVLTTLYPGRHRIGTDIPAGRYVVTSSGSGNFFVRDSNNIASVNEILVDRSSKLGVQSFTLDLVERYEIELSGMDYAVFTPADTEFSNTLSAGQWIVGLDIEPGYYAANFESRDSGNFIIYERGVPVVNEIFNEYGEKYGTRRVEVELKTGQNIYICGMPEVVFYLLDTPEE